MMLLLKLIRSHWTWHLVALAALTALAGLWRHESGQAARVAAQCEQARVEAVNVALREQAEGWASVYAAQQEAVARMAQEAGVAAANAREWKRRFDTAKRTPACKAWLEASVECPVN